jgi:hypothetical protein
MEVSGQHQVPAALPSEKVPGTHWIGGWWAPEPSGRYGDEKKLAPAENQTPTVQPVPHHYTVSAGTYGNHCALEVKITWYRSVRD